MSGTARAARGLAMGAATMIGGAARARGDDGGASSTEVRWERPPAGTLERGLLGVPAWAVVALGVLVVGLAAAALIGSARRARRAR